VTSRRCRDRSSLENERLGMAGGDCFDVLVSPFLGQLAMQNDVQTPVRHNDIPRQGAIAMSRASVYPKYASIYLFSVTRPPA
jgi:hypothetical protein